MHGLILTKITKFNVLLTEKTEKQLYFHSYFRAVDDQANEL